jgi:hypothetical protein
MSSIATPNHSTNNTASDQQGPLPTKKRKAKVESFALPQLPLKKKFKHWRAGFHAIYGNVDGVIPKGTNSPKGSLAGYAPNTEWVDGQILPGQDPDVTLTDLFGIADR